MTHPFRKRSRPPVLPDDSLSYSVLQASELVAQVGEGSNLTECYEAMLAAHAGWADGVRGAVRDLAWVSLRDYGRQDPVLRHYLRKPLPLRVEAMLRIALSRLERRPDEAYKIVDQAVAAVGAIAPGLKGVANGVLRASEREKAYCAALRAADPVATHRHPLWWIERLRAAYPERWEAVLSAGNQRPPMSLRINPRRTERESVERRLRESKHGFRTLDNGALLLDLPCAATALPGFAEGWISVQDSGAQWAAHWLDLADGQRVLDACAAPGGKAAHLLETADVDLLALEIDPTRARRIQANLERLGLDARVCVADARNERDWWDGRPFERILADVPCSASGVVRRHPDIKWHRRAEDIAHFARQAAQILESLWRTLAPGGKMLFVTCSVFDDENGKQIERFCKRHEDAERVPLDGRLDRQLLPDAEQDGFYYALLRKRE